MTVELCYPQRLLEEVGDGLGLLERVLLSGRYIGGPAVLQLEQDCAAYLGVGHAVSCGSGTDALELALRALELPPNAGVATPALTFTATASAIVAAGLLPVFVDVDPQTLTLSPEALEEAANKHEVAAVVPVSLFGRPVDPQVFAVANELRLWVVEDACQSFGAGSVGDRVGRQAALTAFSFFPTKPLGGIGDGGLVVTAHGERARRVQALARHGFVERKHEPVVPGRNSRLDALQAAVLLAKLPWVDTWRARRKQQAARYDKALASRFELLPPAEQHAYSIYAIRSLRRDHLAAHLRACGIACAVHYPKGLHQTQAFRSDCQLPHTERAVTELLSLPICAGLRDDEQDRVIEALER